MTDTEHICDGGTREELPEGDLVANVEEGTAVEADVQEDAAVLADGEDVVGPRDALLPVEHEGAHEEGG